MKRRKNEPTNPRKLLLSACVFGGHKRRIQELLAQYTYTPEDLSAAIDVLNKSATSAGEVDDARIHADYLRRIMVGMKLASRLSTSPNRR